MLICMIERHVDSFYKVLLVLIFYRISTNFLQRKLCRATCVDSTKFLQFLHIERHVFRFYKVNVKIKYLHEITQDDDQLLIHIVERRYTIDPAYTSNYIKAIQVPLHNMEPQHHIT